MVPRSKVISASPTLKISGAYTSGNVMGGLVTFPNLNLLNGSATIRRVLIADDDNEKSALNLWLFRSSPTVLADDVAFAPLIADLKTLVAVIPVLAANYTTINSNAYAVLDGLGTTFGLTLPSNSLYMYVVANGTPTYTASTDLYIEMTLWVD